MGLTLSDPDLSHYQNLASVLLAPMAYETPELWTSAACRALMTLCDAHSAAFILPRSESVHLHVDGMDPELIRKFQSFLGSPEDEGIDWSEERLDEAMHAGRNAGLGVFTSDDVTRLTGVPLEKQPYFREVLEPSGIGYTTAMAVAAPPGRAIMSVGHESRESGRFRNAEPALLRLLLPIFRAGVLTQRRVARQRHALGALFDELGDAVGIFDLGGEPRVRNCELTNLGEGDPDFDFLMGHMRRLAREVGRSITDAPLATSDLVRAGSRVIATRCDRYSLTPTILPPGMALHEPAILITVRAATPRLPTRDQLRERYGLTKRESQVALLLANGRSNGNIAARLGISPHTARHHAQRVLQKVGAPSRKALGLRFLRGGAQP